MFLENKYKKYYFNIINNAIINQRCKNDGSFYENHHILPNSLGGSNDKDNMVLLTPKEHYVCHLLLTKMTLGEDKQKMCKAIWMMKGRCSSDEKTFNSKIYENIKIEFSKNQSIITKERWANDDFKNEMIQRKMGCRHSKETKEKMSISARKRHINNPLSEESIKKMKTKLNGRNLSEEHKKNIGLGGIGIKKPGTSKKLKNIKKEKVKCPHCNKEGGKPVMTRYHFNNCKNKVDE